MKYKNSYHRLLNDFSDKAMRFDENTINTYRKNIEKFIDKIEIGDRIPNLLLESLYFSSLYIKGDYIIENDFAIKLGKNPSYESYIKNSSSSKSKVKGRLNYVYMQLSKYVNGNKG